MGKMVFAAVLGAMAAGAGFGAYNAVRYDVLQPFPLAWNRLAEEVTLLELEHRRRELLAKIGSAQRISSLSGYVSLEAGGPGDELKAELASLDATIEALKAGIRAIKAQRRNSEGR